MPKGQRSTFGKTFWDALGGMVVKGICKGKDEVARKERDEGLRSEWTSTDLCTFSTKSYY